MKRNSLISGVVKKAVALAMSTMLMCGMLVGCGEAEQPAAEQPAVEAEQSAETTEEATEEVADEADSAEEAVDLETTIVTYEFETYDGETVVIDETNIVSQEVVEDVLEWADLPADAEQMAPGRDIILFADADHYYVEDAEDNILTIAVKLDTEADGEVTIMTYTFETFDGETVVIDENNIVSQEVVEDALEWADLPADAEQMAPGRDYILFANSEYYYVEDAEDNIVTIAVISAE